MSSAVVKTMGFALALAVALPIAQRAHAQDVKSIEICVEGPRIPCFDAEAVTFGAQVPGDPGLGGGGGAGKPSFSEVVISKLVDRTSTDLFGQLVSGENIDTLSITYALGSGNPYVLSLEDVQLTSLSVSAGVGSALVENLSLAFGKICVIRGARQSCFDLVELEPF